MLKKYCFVLLSMVFLSNSNAQEQVGFASVRPPAHEGMMTQSNVLFSHDSLVASHRSIPLGKIVKVTNLSNMKFVVLKINDRGPYVKNRILDLSERAAVNIGLRQKDVIKVRLEILEDHTNIPTESYQMPEEVTYSETSEMRYKEVAETDDIENTTPNGNLIAEKPDDTPAETSPSTTKEDNTPTSEALTTQETSNGKQKTIKDSNEEIIESKTKALLEKENKVANTTKAKENSPITVGPSIEKKDERLDTNDAEKGPLNKDKTSDVSKSSNALSSSTNGMNTGKTYALQVGSFSVKSNAYAYSKTLSENYKIDNNNVKRVEKDDSYKVVIGRFTDVQLAKEYKDNLVNNEGVFNESSVLIVDNEFNIVPSATSSQAEQKETTKTVLAIEGISDVPKDTASDNGSEDKDTTETSTNTSDFKSAQHKQEEDKEQKLYTIQVGSFDNKEDAQAFAKELLDNHSIFNLKVQPYEKDGSAHYKVVAGRFTAQKFAQVYKNQLESKIKNTSIVELKD